MRGAKGSGGAIRRHARWRVHPAPLQTGTGLRPRIHGGLPAAPTSPATAPAARPRAAATPDGRAGTTRRWVQAKPRCGPLQTVTSQARRITPTIMIRICALGSGGWAVRRGAGRALRGRGRPICSRSTPWVDNGRRGWGQALGRAPARVTRGRRGSRWRRVRALPGTWARRCRPGHTGRGHHAHRSARRAARTRCCLRRC